MGAQAYWGRTGAYSGILGAERRLWSPEFLARWLVGGVLLLSTGRLCIRSRHLLSVVISGIVCCLLSVASRPRLFFDFLPRILAQWLNHALDHALDGGTRLLRRYKSPSKEHVLAVLVPFYFYFW